MGKRRKLLFVLTSAALVFYCVLAFNSIQGKQEDARADAIVQTVEAATHESKANPSTLTEIVENNVFLFTPAKGESREYDQLDQALRNVGEKYRILGLVIAERKQYSGGVIVSS